MTTCTTVITCYSSMCLPQTSKECTIYYLPSEFGSLSQGPCHCAKRNNPPTMSQCTNCNSFLLQANVHLINGKITLATLAELFSPLTTHSSTSYLVILPGFVARKGNELEIMSWDTHGQGRVQQLLND